MDRQQNGEMWTAYLDGELSASEISEFDRALTPEDRERLAAEMGLENALNEAISQRAECPESLWTSIVTQIEGVVAPAHGSVASFLWRSQWWIYPLVAAAAVTIVVAYAFVIPTRAGLPPFLNVAYASVSEMEGDVEIRPANLTHSCKHRGFDVLIVSAPEQHEAHEHMTVLLGARVERFEKETVLRLFFNCCEKPVQVVLVKINGRAAAAVGEAIAEGRVSYSQRVGDSLAAVVGPHYTPDLMDFVSAI